MREVLYEESSTLINFKQANFKYNLLLAVAIISFLLIAPWLLVFAPAWLFNAKISWIVKILLGGFPVLIFFFIGFFALKAKDKFYVEYDYSFVNGSIRFSKVIKQKKRKFINKFDAKDIEMIGKMGSEQFYKYLEQENILTHVLTKNNAPANEKDFYYIVVTIDAQPYMFVIECTETFIANVLSFSRGIGILEKELRRK